MAFLSREMILAAQDIMVEEVDVPEWGGTIRLKALTGAQRDKIEQAAVVQRGRKTSMDMVNFRAKIIAASAVDEEGHLLFTEKDVVALGKKAAGVLDRLSEVASRISGMSDEDIEEMTEGFTDDPSDFSTSD